MKTLQYILTVGLLSGLAVAPTEEPQIKIPANGWYRLQWRQEGDQIYETQTGAAELQHLKENRILMDSWDAPGDHDSSVQLEFLTYGECDIVIPRENRPDRRNPGIYKIDERGRLHLLLAKGSDRFRPIDFQHSRYANDRGYTYLVFAPMTATEQIKWATPLPPSE